MTKNFSVNKAAQVYSSGNTPTERLSGGLEAIKLFIANAQYSEAEMLADELQKEVDKELGGADWWERKEFSTTRGKE